MAKMTAAEAVVRVLESEGVQHAWGIPGAAILPLYQSMEKSGITHYTVRHEEGATHAAEGYTRACGGIGVAIGTSGPAGTNMVTGLYSAIADSIPILTITGQAPRAMLHKEGFQAVNIVDIVKPVTKWAVMVQEAAQAPYIVRKAFRIMRSGRPGPVHIDLPLDVQKEMIEYDPDIDAPLEITPPKPHLPRIEKALDMMANAKRPIIIAGGGVIIGEASKELVEFAEAAGVPVVPTLMGWGSISEDHPLHVGLVGLQTAQRGANAAFLESDFVISVGNRYADRHTGTLDVYRKDRKFVHIDIEPTQLGRVFEPDLGIVSDAKLALKALAEGVKARKKWPTYTAWAERCQDLKARLLRKTDFDDVPIKPQRVFQEINNFFDKDTVFVTAIGVYQILSGQFQKVYKPRHYIICGQAGPLGWEISACMGAKIAEPEKLVVGVVGDFSFQFLIEELAVSVQYRTPYVMILINNSTLGLIRQGQETGYNFNYAVSLGYDNQNTQDKSASYGFDHVKAVEAMGAKAVRVFNPNELRKAFDWAVATAESERIPVVVEVITEHSTNAAMGPTLDNIREFAETIDLPEKKKSDVA